MIERTELANLEYEASLSAYEGENMEQNFDQQLVDHLDEREWSDVQIANLLQKVGRNALLGSQSVLEVLEYQQSIDEQIEAEKEHDTWAIGDGAMIAQSFFEDAEEYRSDAGWDNPPKWDSTGKWLGDPNDRDER